jgi:hypothetical protein
VRSELAKTQQNQEKTMNRFIKVAITAMTALSMWACVENANTNKPANSNANTNTNSTTAKAPPTLDALMAIEKGAQEAYTKGDTAYFEKILADKFSMGMNGQQMDRAATIKMIGATKCDVKSTSFDEQKMSMIDPDTAALVYKATMDGTCTENGKTEKIPSPTRAATVVVRSGNDWKAVWHGETAIVDPKNMKTDEKPAAPPKAEEKKTESNANTPANSNSAETTKPAADPTIDAIIAVEKSGWEAWKAQDAAKLTSMSTSNLAFVGWTGSYTGTQADTVKSWTDGSCKVNSVSVTDGTGVMISPTLGMIMFKGSADGTCGDMKIKPVWGTSFYVKEGDTWKIAFGFENPAM